VRPLLSLHPFPLSLSLKKGRVIDKAVFISVETRGCLSLVEGRARLTTIKNDKTRTIQL
jgi:hypothetical protein